MNWITPDHLGVYLFAVGRFDPDPVADVNRLIRSNNVLLLVVRTACRIAGSAIDQHCV